MSIANLSLSCYPDHLEYIDQIFSYATSKVREYQQNPDLHAPPTAANLLALLLAPIQSYVSVLTLLAIPSYIPLLSVQPYTTRAAISHAVVSSVLKNNTQIETTDDVEGVLGLCAVLVRDQKDSQGGSLAPARRPPPDLRELAEEQGWVARMIHLFRTEDLGVQQELLQTAYKQLADGGERIRWTFPPLITSAIQLARRFKARQSEEKDWEPRISSLFKFIHRLISILYTKVEAPEVCLRLFLLAAQVSDECGLEELTYEFFVQAFVIYEESISESRAQLMAITGIISALQGSRVFGADNYDTLITKAALHGSKLLKKGHQATAVLYASHMWWQTGGDERPNPPLRDGKRVLECLQKSLRIATGCIDELTSVQLYVDALDRYIYYFEQGVDAVTPKYINSLVELITSNIDAVHSTDVHPSSASPPGLVDGVNTPDMVVKVSCERSERRPRRSRGRGVRSRRSRGREHGLCGRSRCRRPRRRKGPAARCRRGRRLRKPRPTRHSCPLSVIADTQHFKNTLRYIQNKQRAHRDAPEAEGEDKPADWSAVDVVGGCLKMGLA